MHFCFKKDMLGQQCCTMLVSFEQDFNGPFPFYMKFEKDSK